MGSTCREMNSIFLMLVCVCVFTHRFEVKFTLYYQLSSDRDRRGKRLACVHKILGGWAWLGLGCRGLPS